MDRRLSPEVRVLDDAAAVAAAASEIVCHTARQAVAARGTFSVVLSGGSTPTLLHRSLAAEPERLPWRMTEVFFGDERCVPPDDPASNYGMAERTLLSHVPLAPGAVHRIRGELPGADAARAYEAELRTRQGNGLLLFDLVLLGMGPDGHTASLFPGGDGLAESERLVVAARAPVAPHDRVTLTMQALAQTRSLVFLVTGVGKAKALDQVMQQLSGRSDPVLPAARIRPREGRANWLVDRAAARAMDDHAG